MAMDEGNELSPVWYIVARYRRIHLMSTDTGCFRKKFSL